MAERFSADALTRFAVELLQKAGLDAVLSEAVAHTLAEGDLLGHDTHGLALLGHYIKELKNGTMARAGAPAGLRVTVVPIRQMAGAPRCSCRCTIRRHSAAPRIFCARPIGLARHAEEIRHGPASMKCTYLATGGLSRMKEQMRDGIMLHPTIPPMLAECAQRYGMQFPASLEN